MKDRFHTFIPRLKVYSDFFDKLVVRTKVLELGTEEILGYASAEDVYSPENLPGFDKSTVDGYAVIAENTTNANKSTPVVLKVVGEIYMGEEFKEEISSGECVRIPTGGMLPKGANACVMIEDTKEFNGNVEIYKPVVSGENVIKKDKDVKKGSLVVKKGETINIGHIHNLLSLGITKVKVFKKPSVCIIPTGDEIIEPSEKRIKTQIRDGNSYALMAWLKSLGYDVRKYKVVKDDPEEFKEAVKWGLENGDVVVLSGGSSVGARDYALSTIEYFGEVLFSGVQVKPGKPVIFGKTDKKLIFGLPGNPTSFIVSSYLFLIPVLKKISGHEDFLPKLTCYVRVTEDIPNTSGREKFVFVKLRNEGNEILAQPIFGESGIASPMKFADGLIRIPLNKEIIYKNEICEFYSWRS
ncbi:molybdopterin molybdotransferase MoeA [Thermosipho atlanticus]|uniref:Molybdopterin molybdenumtransferase n=1 Tax=Thermosipho atlanticus DSM 15807 TaxID=1123380 RepID=A0A1M5T9Z3_9BACT|nr:gephyrin-like molybdotransferase Glp [Thermosipho atlanticus]SHH47518.1 molybdopterin molybdochelatase [Thermosipho atlanticus DSM 15807]